MTMQIMSLIRNDCLLNPEWMPYSICVTDNGATLTFVKLTANQVAESAFLDHRIKFDTAPETTSLFVSPENIDLIINDTSETPFGLIVHTGFCGSTLIAGLLNRRGERLVMREPYILTSFLELSQTSQLEPHFVSKLFSLILNLLSRKWAPNEQIIIKPSNLATSLAMSMAARSGRTIAIYSSEEKFLRSVLWRGEAGRNFLRQLFVAQTNDGGLSFLAKDELLKLSDLQAGVLAWRAQLGTLKNLFSSTDGSTMKSVLFEQYQRDPISGLRQIQRHFHDGENEPPIDEDAVRAAMRLDSKTSQPVVDKAPLSPDTLRAIAEAIAWADKVGVVPVVGAGLPCSALS